MSKHKSSELLEYRVHLPCTVAEYRVGQMYTVAKHCNQQSRAAEGVRVMVNEPYVSPELGPGRYCEKRLYLGSRLPSWVTKMLPGGGPFALEKSYNHYPYTRTEYSCSFLPKLHIRVDTKFSDGPVEEENIFDLSPADLQRRRVVPIDVAFDRVDPKKYKLEEDLTKLNSPTGRLPLQRGWQRTAQPVLCSYKLVVASFHVWGLQKRVESYMVDAIQQIVTDFHRQAAACIDEWLGLSEEEARNIEKRLNEEMNRKVAGDSGRGASSGDNAIGAAAS